MVPRQAWTSSERMARSASRENSTATSLLPCDQTEPRGGFGLKDCQALPMLPCLSKGLITASCCPSTIWA